PRRVRDRLSPPYLDVARREEQRLPAELVRAHLERHAGPGARFREDHRQGLPGERRFPVAAGLHSAGEVEQPQDLVPGEEILRSEEHTSELQSLAYLVCRLL